MFEKIVFVYIFLIQQTLLAVLYIIYPLSPDQHIPSKMTSGTADNEEEGKVKAARDDVPNNSDLSQNYWVNKNANGDFKRTTQVFINQGQQV